jgi:pilus assembly protein Flp/PilA
MNDHIEVQQAENDRERGASLVEYALLLALIAIVCIVAVTTLGSNLSDSFDSSNDSIFGP